MWTILPAPHSQAAPSQFPYLRPLTSDPSSQAPHLRPPTQATILGLPPNIYPRPQTLQLGFSTSDPPSQAPLPPRCLLYRLAFSSHNFFFAFREIDRDTLVFLHPEPRDVATRVSVRYGVNGSFGSLAGVTYLCYTVLTSSNKSQTAAHFCNPALSVLAMLVSRNVFHVVSALQSVVFILFLMRVSGM